ncbi:SOS response associated peptidase (SRAP) [Dyadobacter jiangsuensis]|uniref:Abasic site processing protein n=1 Tax=Dyadobacter jiangsuensis TaxID=1591085 RepID=A0A2P8F8P4_9BACT|nr:SOS response associated peptidase (SRAP) [Dyadobacter jiangsuensis]
MLRRQLCYDISLHSDIELTKEVFPKIKDKRIIQDSPVYDHISSFAFPEYPVIARQGTERVLGDTRSYAHRIRQNRCLIPVTGTYEHRAIQGWAKKVPYYIWPKDRKMQFLPGLFQIIETTGPAGEKRQSASFGMLTRTANELMANIHNDGEFRHRMPLHLTPELESFWVSEHLTDDDLQVVFDYMLPAEALDCHPVFSIRDKKPRPDGKPKFKFWRYENLPPLGDDKSSESQLSIFNI